MKKEIKEPEVTHDVFFGENLARLRHALLSKKAVVNYEGKDRRTAFDEDFGRDKVELINAHLNNPRITFTSDDK